MTSQRSDIKCVYTAYVMFIDIIKRFGMARFFEWILNEASYAHRG